MLAVYCSILEHHLDAKNNLDLPIYLLLHALADVCTLQVIWLYVILPNSVISIDSNTVINIINLKAS